MKNNNSNIVVGKPKNINNIKYISSSRHGSYDKCKLQFYKTVILGQHDQYSEYYEEDSDDPVYLIFGKAMHKTLEIFHKDRYTKKSDLRKLFRDSYADYGLTDVDYYYLGLDMCENHFAYLKNEAPKRVLVGTEMFFSIIIGKDKYGNDVTAQGTIDCVWYLGNGLYEITDYKTSNWLPSQDELEANMQIGMYDMAYRSPEMSKYWYKGIEPKAILLSMEYLRFEDGVLKTEISDEDREINRLYFIDIFTQMKYKDEKFFVPRLNRMCYYCDCKDECPKYQTLLDGNTDEIIDFDINEEGFAENIRRINLYKSVIKNLEKELGDLNEECADYIKHNDVDVIVDDEKYFLANSSRRYLIPQMTIKILKKHGLWDEKEFITSIPLGKVEHLCKGHPEAWSEIEAKTLRRSHGQATLKSKVVPKSTLFVNKKRK